MDDLSDPRNSGFEGAHGRPGAGDRSAMAGHSPSRFGGHPPSDIASFRAIVYPPDPESGADAWDVPTATVDCGVESVRNGGAAPPDGSLQGPLPPADRIMDTLRPLRGVHRL